jgi:hypothetical protein
LNSEDPVVKGYAKLRRTLVRNKFNRETAIFKAQNKIKERIKNFDAIASGTGIQKGFYYDITTNETSQNPDVQELENSDFKNRTTGAGGDTNQTGPRENAPNQAAINKGLADDINKINNGPQADKAKKIAAADAKKADAIKEKRARGTGARAPNTQAAGASTATNPGMPGNSAPGGGGRNNPANNTGIGAGGKPVPSTPKGTSFPPKTSVPKGYTPSDVKPIGKPAGGGAGWGGGTSGNGGGAGWSDVGTSGKTGGGGGGTNWGTDGGGGGTGWEEPGGNRGVSGGAR